LRTINFDNQLNIKHPHEHYLIKFDEIRIIVQIFYDIFLLLEEQIFYDLNDQFVKKKT